MRLVGADVAVGLIYTLPEVYGVASGVQGANLPYKLHGFNSGSRSPGPPHPPPRQTLDASGRGAEGNPPLQARRVQSTLDRPFWGL